jgi:hypothetical protein
LSIFAVTPHDRAQQRRRSAPREGGLRAAATCAHPPRWECFPRCPAL